LNEITREEANGEGPAIESLHRQQKAAAEPDGIVDGLEVQDAQTLGLLLAQSQLLLRLSVLALLERSLQLEQLSQTVEK